MKNDINFCEILRTPQFPSDKVDANEALLWARDVVQGYLSKTHQVNDSKGIDELKCINIGGVDQWVHIRGRDRNNPVLLFLHGGPGSPIICCLDSIQRPWEDYFTVVKWDQRQTGKSYYATDDDNNPLTVRQFVEDTHDIVEYLREYLRKDKLFIMANSWGTVLGMHLLKRKPNWVHAYVGLGQVVNALENEKTLYQRALDQAIRAGEVDLANKIKKLIAIMESGTSEMEKSWVENSNFVRKELSRLSGETLARHFLWDDVIEIINLDVFFSPSYSLEDVRNFFGGDKPALYREPYNFTKDFFKIDLPKDVGSSFDVPIFFFTGSHDWQTPAMLSDQWFEQLVAPYKELVHFENSAHIPMMEEPGRVLFELVNKVLPFAEKNYFV